MEKKLRLEDVPEAIIEIDRKVTKIEALLKDLQYISNSSKVDSLLTVQKVADLLEVTPSTIYRYTRNNTIPVCKGPSTKRLYFSRQQIIDWIKSGRRKTVTEISNDVDSLLNEKGKSN